MAASASTAADYRPSPPRRVPPAWSGPASMLLCLAGLAVSGYLTIAHFSTELVLSCPDSGVVNCAKVTSAPQSMIFGLVPVALLGLGYFVVMSLLCSPHAWRSGTPVLRLARQGGVISGMAMVCYLVYVEFRVLGAVCLWCTAVHVITFVLFVVVLAAEALSETAPAIHRSEG